jgi:hypothetical protein
MRNAINGTLVAALIVSLSGAAYAQGAGAGGGGGVAGGNKAGQGGTRMGTRNAAGSTDTMSGAPGVNMGTSPSGSQKMQKQNSGEMESPPRAADSRNHIDNGAPLAEPVRTRAVSNGGRRP